MNFMAIFMFFIGFLFIAFVFGFCLVEKIIVGIIVGGFLTFVFGFAIFTMIVGTIQEKIKQKEIIQNGTIYTATIMESTENELYVIAVINGEEKEFNFNGSFNENKYPYGAKIDIATDGETTVIVPRSMRY